MKAPASQDTPTTVLPIVVDRAEDHRRVRSAMVSAFGAGAGLLTIALLISHGTINWRLLVAPVLVGIVLACLSHAFVNLSTRSAVRELDELVAATVEREVAKPLRELAESMRNKPAEEEDTVPMGRPRAKGQLYVAHSSTHSHADAVAEALMRHARVYIDEQLSDMGVLVDNQRAINGHAHGNVSHLPTAR